MNHVPSLTLEAENAAEYSHQEGLDTLISLMAALKQFNQVPRQEVEPKQPSIKFDSNEELWTKFHKRLLPDTTRVRLEHFHLFEYFPLFPGGYYSERSEFYRQQAKWMMNREPDGSYYNPEGKFHMVMAGIGAVKLKAHPMLNERGIQEDHYLMTASSDDVCHKGVPVLIPRSKYGSIISRLRQEGAVPVVIDGEMKRLPDDFRTFFQEWVLSNIPYLAIYVNDIQPLQHPRSSVTSYKVATVLSFYGTFQSHQNVYMTYCTFDPASQDSQKRQLAWLKEYVQKYEGQVITDFDEESPEFRNAPIALKKVMNGTLDPLAIQELMNKLGFYYTSLGETINNINIGPGGTYVGSRGVNIGGDVGGHVVTGDNNELAPTQKPE